MKNVLQTDSQKRDKESTSTYLTALSNKTVKKVGGWVDTGAKKMNI